MLRAILGIQAYSTGGSSGGSSALVAAGVIPIAHANDGAGSIRIPASCCGLVGLKPSRGRIKDKEVPGYFPANILHDGVVTRTVRDTWAFHTSIEQAIILQKSILLLVKSRKLTEVICELQY